MLRSSQLYYFLFSFFSLSFSIENYGLRFYRISNIWYETVFSTWLIITGTWKEINTIMFLEEWKFEITNEITYDDNSIISEKRKEE